MMTTVVGMLYPVTMILIKSVKLRTANFATEPISGRMGMGVRRNRPTVQYLPEATLAKL